MTSQMFAMSLGGGLMKSQREAERRRSESERETHGREGQGREEKKDWWEQTLRRQ